MERECDLDRQKRKQKTAESGNCSTSTNEHSAKGHTLIKSSTRKQNMIIKAKEVRKCVNSDQPVLLMICKHVLLNVDELDRALPSGVVALSQVKQGENELIMACSIPNSIGEYQNLHEVCLLSVVSLYDPLVFNFTHESVLLVGRSNGVSMGVLALESCPMPSYPFATSVPSDDQSNAVERVQSVLHYISCILEDPKRCNRSYMRYLRGVIGVKP